MEYPTVVNPLFCPICLKETKPIGLPDDTGAQYYQCENNHKISNQEEINKPIDKQQRDYRETIRQESHATFQQYTPDKIKKIKESVRIQEQQNGEREAQRESQADRIYKIFCNNKVELFHDQNKTEYARIPITIGGQEQSLENTNDTNGINDTSRVLLPSILLGKEEETHRITSENTVNIVNTVSYFETVRLKDASFRSYLSHLLYEDEGKVANSEAVAQVVLLLKFEASQQKCYNLFNRIAPDPSGDGSIWLDLADKQNRAYHITKYGWTLESNAPILFRRYEHQQPLAVAVKNGDARKLLKFVNVGANKKSELTKQQQLLLLVQTASYLVPDIAHPVNAMFGGPGTHKSCAQRFIREIFDASAAPLLKIPRDENAALQVLDHHYIPIFDNLDYLPRWLSDMLCCAVTGAGQESRVLYSDDDSFIRTFRRCVMLNGLNLPTTKGDLLNRTIMHPTEPSIERLTEQELNAEYLKVLPEILGGFLDVAARALSLKGKLIPPKLFRLADFTEWGYLLAEALGYGAQSFIEAMDANLNNQNIKDIENNVVADAFLSYCTETLDFVAASEENPKGLAPEAVFKAVTAKAECLGINTKNSKRWPSAPNAFTRKLNESKTAIVSCGWNYEMIHDGKSRKMQIWHMEKETPPPQPPEQVKLPTVESNILHVHLLPPNETHTCDICNAVYAKYSSPNTTGQPVYYCQRCIDSKKPEIEASGFKLVIDYPQVEDYS